MKKAVIFLLILAAVPAIYLVLNKSEVEERDIEESPVTTTEDMSSSKVEEEKMETNTDSTADSVLIGKTPAETTASKCEGLTGELEMQVLVGPADAVGMEPVAVGSVPFSVITSENIFLVDGEGSVSYQDTLAQVWGTYSVSLDMEGNLEGECSGEPGNETLAVTATMSGNQMVEVRSEGFNGDYPWEGTQTLDLNFPLQEGATAEGEGWAFILHLSE